MKSYKLEKRLVKRFGVLVVQMRYDFEPWGNWFFLVKTEEELTPAQKKYWIYMPDLGLWRRNTSID